MQVLFNVWQNFLVSRPCLALDVQGQFFYYFFNSFSQSGFYIPLDSVSCGCVNTNTVFIGRISIGCMFLLETRQDSYKSVFGTEFCLKTYSSQLAMLTLLFFSKNQLQVLLNLKPYSPLQAPRVFLGGQSEKVPERLAWYLSPFQYFLSSIHFGFCLLLRFFKQRIMLLTD